jgi:CelD/BcsL family acetyltransferase involved in cellulose biosynthesis
MRHFERLGPLDIRFAHSATEAAGFFDDLKRLHIPSWERRGKAHAFTRPYFEVFHRALIERAFPATELSQVSTGGRVLGYLYNFRYRDRVYAYQSGFDDADRSERPGVVCHALAIAEAFRRGAAFYDFMAGRNRLKESFATEVTPMFWQVVQQPRLLLRLEALARQVKKSLLAGPSEG